MILKNLLNIIKNKYDNCKDKRDGVSGCRDCCKKYFIKYNEYKECVKVCMDYNKKTN
jgi:hypothetical protein